MDMHPWALNPHMGVSVVLSLRHHVGGIPCQAPLIGRSKFDDFNRFLAIPV
jgi:hypothetical protein